jgi:hydroxymethylpyrimidine pyrophosphatase-like HAD family hydrolase
MTRRFAADVLDLDVDAACAAVVFCGDSPNDAPMFAHFPNACGVANVRDFAGRMEAEPAYVAPSRGGAGFVEIAETLLAAAERKTG